MRDPLSDVDIFGMCLKPTNEHQHTILTNNKQHFLKTIIGIHIEILSDTIFLHVMETLSTPTHTQNHTKTLVLNPSKIISRSMPKYCQTDRAYRVRPS